MLQYAGNICVELMWKFRTLLVCLPSLSYVFKGCVYPQGERF